MGQVFPRSANTLSRASIFGAVFVLAALLWVSATVARSPYFTDVGMPAEQPVPFSHKHHVQGVGLDCRYCHTSVENSSFAGIPPTETCMTCHSQIWLDSPLLEPVKRSYETGQPMTWNRVHDLPDYVYFNHSIHLKKGVGCVSCHGQVEEMPLVWKAHTLHMDWCLDCHRSPEKFVRPVAEVFNSGWERETSSMQGDELVREYGIQRMTNCSTCHR